jgi:2-methylcitrate dehydratase PrpD
MDRRSFIRIGAAASAIATSSVPPMAGQAFAAEETPKAPAAAKDVTKTLARYAVNARFEDLPERVRKEVARSLLNWMGVTVGGSRHQTVDIAISAIQPFAGPAQAGLFGRKERLDIMNAALINGISSHVLDFDDTDLKTAVHPSAPVLPALLAMAEHKPINGRDFVTAVVIGFEAECRIARAVQPAFGDIGWHATGAAGVFGAAVATGRILGLDETRMCHAIGLAATQPVGIREMFGSMTKSFHPGRAAQNGMLAAFLADKGYTSSLQGIEAKRGWANLVSTDHDLSVITDGLGDSFEIYRNTYKPYACGLVIHPVIDGCIQLRNEYKLTADQIEAIDVDIHPIVMELTAKKNPKTGLEGKFSVFYAAALAITAGKAGESQFTDQAVAEPAVVALQQRVTAAIDKTIKEDQARVKIRLKDGRVLERFVVHVIGSVENPLSDAGLQEKFSDLCAGVLTTDKMHRLADLCHAPEKLEDAGEIGRAAAA